MTKIEIIQELKRAAKPHLIELFGAIPNELSEGHCTQFMEYLGVITYFLAMQLEKEEKKGDSNV